MTLDPAIDLAPRVDRVPDDRRAGPRTRCTTRRRNPAFVGARRVSARRSSSCPTAARRRTRSTALDLSKQLLTSRGIAVVDVDYGGSTGYGREYRRRLDGAVGRRRRRRLHRGGRAFLVERGDVDPDRLAIEGGSAGGYTTLAALAFRDVFAAGHQPVRRRRPRAPRARHPQVRVALRPTGWSARTRRRRRSTASARRSTAVDRISCPVLVLQGLDDRVVPPSQAEAIVAALAANGIPYAYLASRARATGSAARAPSGARSRRSLSFLGQVFGFEPADQLEPLEVAGLDDVARAPRRDAPRPRRGRRRGRRPADGAQPDRAGPRPARRGRRARLRRPPDRRRLPDPAACSAGSSSASCPGCRRSSSSPTVVFLLLLPPILFGAGYSTPIRDFKANARPIALLAVGLVLFTTVVGRARRPCAVIPGSASAAAFALGAIVAPPDAVAATAIFRRLGVPRRIVTILEGESLINDATALIAYRFAVVGGARAASSRSREAGVAFVFVGARRRRRRAHRRAWS